MENQFNTLVGVSTQQDAAEAEKFFLDKTKEAIDEDMTATALEIAAQFDEFRRQARDEYGEPFYAGFFATLSDLIKRHHEP